MADIPPSGPDGTAGCGDPIEHGLRLLIADLDRVPDEVIAAAKGALAWRTVEAELAELTDDSALSGSAGIRGDGHTRLLAFETTAVSVVIEVEAACGGRRRLLGQLVCPGRGAAATQTGDTAEGALGAGLCEGAEIEVRHPVPAGTGQRSSAHRHPASPDRWVRADSLGRFRAETQAGPLSLAVRFPGQAEPTVVTSWVTV